MKQIHDSPNLVLSSADGQLRPRIGGLGGPISWKPRPIYDPLKPISGGTTGSWMRSLDAQEIYSITWDTSESLFFEMPTAGTALMLPHRNRLFFARKEQCLALGTQLRTIKITNYKIFRILPTGESQYLHPFDNVFPEKVNIERKPISQIDGSLGYWPTFEKELF